MSIVPDEVEGLNAEFPALGSSSVASSGGDRFRRILRILTGFFLGQGALQGVNVLAGLFLVRSLSVEAYAQFGLAFAFQATASSLMDLGYTSTIIPLVGENRDDRARVGRYVRSAKHLRDRAFWLIAPFASIAFFTVMHPHHWSLLTQVLLLLSVLVGLYSTGKISYSSAPYFLYGRLREFYLPQTLAGIGRLGAYLCLRLVSGLNAWTAAAMSALNLTVNGALLDRKGRKFLDWPAHDDPATDREIIRYVLPAAPAIIFSAFQSQISLFLISIFGHTANVAQVAALGKIGQLFSVLMTFNVVVVEPYMARLSRDRLLSRYLMLFLTAFAACTPLVLLAFFLPTPFVWLLGPKYESLRGVIGWVVCAACINYLAGLIWIMNRARKWLFWSGTILEIGLLLLVQVGYVIHFGVHTTRQAVFFTFASSFCYLAAHSYVGILGFVRGERKIVNLSTS